MDLPVLVKSTKRGLRLVLDPEIPYEILKEKIREKFQSTKDFFQDTSFAICFSGRVLSQQQEQELVELITRISKAEILCVLEENELQDAYIEERLQQILLEKQMRSGQFHKGDIYAGQTLECEHSVIILGNVEKGGKVISKGNIVVLGSLKGYAFAGASGNTQAFISALSIETVQLKIADACYRNARLVLPGRDSCRRLSSQIATAKDKIVVIEPLTNRYIQ